MHIFGGTFIYFWALKARHTLAIKSTVANTVDFVADTVDFVADMGEFVAGFGDKSATTWIRLQQLVAVDFTYIHIVKIWQCRAYKIKSSDALQ